MGDYPKFTLHLDRIEENAAKVVEFCASAGVEVVAVPKGVCSDPKVARAMLEGGCASFADSRVQNLAVLKKEFPGVPRTLLRIPMKSELENVVRCADCTLVSMTESIEALNSRCRAMRTTRGILLMFDLGDRREGIFDEEGEIGHFAEVLKKAPNVKLQGVGVNFGCFAGALPGSFALHRLCNAKERLERALGCEVPVCSGGSTSSLMLIERDEMPKGVNQLRVGEGILLGRDVTWQRNIPWLRQDTSYLEVEVVELRLKPTLPEGDIGADAFGNFQKFEDEGTRLRAIVAVGRQDVPSGGLIPLEAGVKILGASSDHTILDVEDMETPPRWGGVLRFAVDYAAMLGLMTSPYVKKEYR